MGYYVYENWTHEGARVHIDSCPYCKHGRGTQPQDGGRMVAGCQAQVDHSQRERKPSNGHKLKVGKTPKVVSIASRERCALSLSPNPPKDTDGRREDSGRGWVRE